MIKGTTTNMFAFKRALLPWFENGNVFAQNTAVRCLKSKVKELKIREFILCTQF